MLQWLHPGGKRPARQWGPSPGCGCVAADVSRCKSLLYICCKISPFICYIYPTVANHRSFWNREFNIFIMIWTCCSCVIRLSSKIFRFQSFFKCWLKKQRGCGAHAQTAEMQSHSVIRYNVLWSIIGFTPSTVIFSNTVRTIIQTV